MTKRALLVGINKYDGAPLQGCVPDVQEAWNLLVEEYQFHPDNVRLLLDGRATKAAIVERLKWLISESYDGDVALFWFSGHGSQIRDYDGDELKDHKDELLVTADMEWWDDPLTDDVLRKIFKRHRDGVNLYVVLDCCHSGSGTRSIGPSPAKAFRDLGDGHVRELQARYCPPPLDIWYREYKRALETNQIGVKQRYSDVPVVDKNGKAAKPGLVTDDEMRHVLISGCRSDQTSADAMFGSEGKFRGALSFVLQDMMRRWPEMSMLELVAEVRNELEKMGFSQEPQLEGPDELLIGRFLSSPKV